MHVLLSYSRKKKLSLYRLSSLAILLLIMAFAFSSCSAKKQTKMESLAPEIINIAIGDGSVLEIDFTMGPGHNHPLMAVWTEDENGNYIETVYVAKSIGTGVFGHATVSEGHWEPGPIKRPAALPYWSHRYGSLPDPENPVPDAITGPTPGSNFVIRAQLPSGYPEKFSVLMEINQSWDWNEYWTNSLYPDDKDYMSSSQPAVVYKAVVEVDGSGNEYVMELIGRSHYAGADGRLYTNTESLTSAKEIAAVIKVRHIK